MRRFLLSLPCLLLIPAAQAQFVPETGTPEAAFANGPIRLTPVSLNLLTHAFPDGKVPVIPMPHRARLDTALLAGAPGPLEARIKELGAPMAMKRCCCGSGRASLAPAGSPSPRSMPATSPNTPKRGKPSPCSGSTPSPPP